MNSLFNRRIKTTRLPIVLFFGALFVVGCSGSSDSQSIAEADALDTDAINTVADDVVADDVVTNSDDGAIDSDTDTIENDTVVVTPEDTVDTTADGSLDADETEPTPVAPDAVEPDPVVSDPVVQDPVALVSTRVDFDITVPAFQSNALQVRLQWGDRDISAAFVVDESWSVVDDFPVDTENTLIVSFNDDNGAITLGSFEQPFRTGSNESESFQITADQFDTDRWDDDGDGVSNLDELIAGADPLVAGIPVSPSQLPQAAQAELELVQDKTFRISWQPSEGAEFYRVLENPDDISGFSQVSDDLGSAVQTFDQRVALFKKFNASYIVQACNASGCTDSDELIVSGTLEQAIGYFKASNTEFEEFFGDVVSLSLDGSTLAVGATSTQPLLNTGESDLVYVFQRDNGSYTLQALLNSNSEFSAGFGSDISLSADGNTLAVGARRESAVYIFERSDGAWQQQAFLEASNAFFNDQFGVTVSLDAEGNTLAVGATSEQSAATGVNGDQNDNSLVLAGAVYVFEQSNGTWQQQAYLKASNTDSVDQFGSAISLSPDGNTLAVGAALEDSAATGINGDQSDNSADFSGAVYVFERSNVAWQQQAYVKASNTDSADRFGSTVKLSRDGNLLAVGADGESSAATGINGDQNDNTAGNAGAVYVFERSNGTWQQQTYVKASNTDEEDRFGTAVSLSQDGTTLAVGAPEESSAATGVNGDQDDDSASESGAVYIFVSNNGDWQELTYLKASNTDAFDGFGTGLGLSPNGDTLAIGAIREQSLATGVNGDQNDNSGVFIGAVYLY